MAIKLSSYLWMRNNYLIPIVESSPNNDTARYMKPEEKTELKRVIDEIDGLHKGSDVGHNRDGLVGSNVMLTDYTEIIERSYDSQRSGELFHDIHRILRNHFVSVRIYRDLGQAFAELGIEDIDPELQLAIKYGTEHFNRRSMGIYVGTSDRMCPRVVIDTQLKSRGNSPERS